MLTQPPSPVQTARRAASVVVLVACGIFSPLGLGLGLLTRWYCSRTWDYKERWAGVWAFVLLFGVIYALILWFKHPFPFLFTAIWLDLRTGHPALAGEWLGILWAYNGILLTPLFALVYEALSPRTQRVRIQSRQRLLSAKQARGEATLTSQGFRQVGDVLVGFPECLGEHGVIGRPLGGDLWQWVVDGSFVYPLYALMYHAVLAGRSGTGKSELLRRIAYLAAKIYHMKVIWVDGKGEWEDAASFQLVMQKAGCKQIGIFPLMAHNGWRGSRQDILNLLMATQIFESDYYRGVTLNVLKFALYAPGLPPVTKSKELLRRIYPPTLLAIYDGLWQAEYLGSLERDALWSPYGRYEAFFSGVLDRLDGEKGFGDWDAAYYLLDKKRLQQQIAPFARYLIEDFQLYLALRQVQRKRQRILLVLDDYSAYSEMVTVVDLFERVRSAGGCVIVSAQGYQSLGPDAERLLEGAATTILNRCSLPEKLIRVAGTRKVPEIALHLEADEDSVEDEEVKSHTMRMVDEPKVQPDDVRKLANGESFFMCGNEVQKVLIERVELDEKQVEDLTTELIQGYEAAQDAYEQAQVARLTQRVAASSKPTHQGKGSRRKKQKAPPPQPPQKASSVGAPPATPDPSPGQLSQSLPGAGTAAVTTPALAETKRRETEGSPPPTPQPKPRSLDDIE